MKETRPLPVDFTALTSTPNKSLKRNYGDSRRRRSTSHFLPKAYFLLQRTPTMNRHNSDTINNDYTNNNINNTSTRSSDNSNTRSTASETTATHRSNSNHHSNNNINNSNHVSISSGSSYASAITIVDEDETKPTTPSIDDLLGDLQSLSIQQKQTAHTSTSSFKKRQQLELKTLNQEYLAAKRAALKRVQNPLAKKWDELYEKTSIVKVPSVKPLNAEEEALVTDIMRKTGPQELAQLKTAIVQYSDIQKLKPGEWLNDEIINFYMELIADRSRSETAIAEKAPSVHCYNTFFCSTLRENGYAKVRRWTKRVDIFSKDLLFVPINYSYHWTLGMIDMKKKTVTIYDSLHGGHRVVSGILMKYLADEHLDKKKEPLDMSDWKINEPKDIPGQQNMHDCGVFTCTFAERLSRAHEFDFSQDDMGVIRKRMVLSIAKKEIV